MAPALEEPSGTGPWIGRAFGPWWPAPAPGNVSAEAKSVLEFDTAVKRFGALVALDGCTFAARPGRLTGFLGPNGAGKTTAMRAVFGLVELDDGCVRWRGSAIEPAHRSRFGYMPEERGLYPRMRVRDQLIYLGNLGEDTPRSVSASVDHWLERFELSSRADDRLDALSHGNQQRVQLIAALVNSPDLLVLDEPFSGLDPLAITTMADLLKEVAAGGATVLFSSHQLDLVEDLCEDVVIIDHGRVVLAGDLVDLRAAVPDRFVEIRFRGPAPQLVGLRSVRLVDSTDGSATLSVEPDADLAMVVASVTASTNVLAFAYRPPTLSQLFRRAVTR
jgi:ABC-2 type transport system ATP-binding protein